MKILSQEEYKEYRQRLRDQGYIMPETIVNLAGQENEFGKAFQPSPSFHKFATYPIPTEIECFLKGAGEA